MREIIPKKLSAEAFAPYGTYSNLLDQGHGTRSGFFPDQIVWKPMADMGASVGYACPCEMRIPWYEYHAASAEIRMPLDGDVIIYVGEPQLEPDIDKLEFFIIPQGTMVCLRPGVVHGRQFPLSDKPVHILILCEASTWENDVKVWQVPQENAPIIKLRNEKEV